MDNTELEIADWRRRINELYARIRTEVDPASAWEIWRAGRDDLFQHHPQSPLLPDDPMRSSGLAYWPYDPRLRFEVTIRPPRRAQMLSVATSSDGTIPLRLAGHITLPEPLDFDLDVWWLQQYGGGLFIPLRDGSAGTASYGGGRYLLDTAKGADLGGTGSAVIVDLNFAYHPSCRYNPKWECPLAPAGNTTMVPVHAGERMSVGS